MAAENINALGLLNEMEMLSKLESLNDQRDELTQIRKSFEEDKIRLLDIMRRYKKYLSLTTKMELLVVIGQIDHDIDDANIFINDVEKDRQEILNR